MQLDSIPFGIPLMEKEDYDLRDNEEEDYAI